MSANTFLTATAATGNAALTATGASTPTLTNVTKGNVVLQTETNFPKRVRAHLDLTGVTFTTVGSGVILVTLALLGLPFWAVPNNPSGGEVVGAFNAILPASPTLPGAVAFVEAVAGGINIIIQQTLAGTVSSATPLLSNTVDFTYMTS